jgi:hypothetical protein
MQYQVRRLGRHTPSRAARAEAPTFARERNKQVMLAPMASEMDEASREVAAPQIPAKLVLHVPRERTVVRVARVPKVLRPVLLHETIEHRRVRLPRQVRRRQAGHLPALAYAVPSLPLRFCSPFLRVPWHGPLQAGPRAKSPVVRIHLRQSARHVGCRHSDRAKSCDRDARLRPAGRDVASATTPRRPNALQAERAWL